MAMVDVAKVNLVPSPSSTPPQYVYNLIVIDDEANSEEWEERKRRDGIKRQDLGKGYRITWWGGDGDGGSWGHGSLDFILKSFLFVEEGDPIIAEGDSFSFTKSSRR